MKTLLAAGFTYHCELLHPDGGLVTFDVHNLMPQDGMNHVLNTVFKSGTQVPSWFMGLYEGNYTPVPTDTAATFPAQAIETTAYATATRPQWVPGTVTNGVVDNAAVRTEFDFSTDKTVYGGFISSSAVKGGSTGTLISAVRFPTPRVITAGSTLRITAGFILTSL